MDGIESGVKLPPILPLDQGIVAKKIDDKGQQGGSPRYMGRPKAAQSDLEEEETPDTVEEKHLIDVVV